MDQLQYLADPDANKAFKSRQQFFRKEFGQDFGGRLARSHHAGTQHEFGDRRIKAVSH